MVLLCVDGGIQQAARGPSWLNWSSGASSLHSSNEPSAPSQGIGPYMPWWDHHEATVSIILVKLHRKRCLDKYPLDGCT